MQDLDHFDHEPVDLMGRVCTDAWSEVLDGTLFISAIVEAECRRNMVAKVIDAVAGGERDPVRLRVIALQEMHG